MFFLLPCSLLDVRPLFNITSALDLKDFFLLFYRPPVHTVTLLAPIFRLLLTRTGELLNYYLHFDLKICFCFSSYSSSAEPVNSSSPTSMPASNSTSQSTAYSNTQSNLSSSSILTSSAFPQTSNKYLSSLYAQIPGLASNTLSPLTKAPSSTSGSVPVTSGAIQGQPMHFHPGTSVSLKDVGGHFNMPLHDSANFMFNQTLTQCKLSEP